MTIFIKRGLKVGIAIFVTLFIYLFMKGFYVGKLCPVDPMFQGGAGAICTRIIETDLFDRSIDYVKPNGTVDKNVRIHYYLKYWPFPVEIKYRYR